MENGVVNGGKEGKSHGIEGSANTNDVWVWMRPHIRFCTIGNCDLLSFFLLIVSLLVSCKFHPLFLFFSFLKTWSFSTEVSPPLFFSILAPLFFRILLFEGEIPLIGIF
jgi:hypothetical protein